MIIAKRHLGEEPHRIEKAMRQLCELSNKIRKGGDPIAALRAAAFFHLRFENIHPLYEGNGRIGRAILATQCQQATGVAAREVLEQLQAHEIDYKLVFQPNDQSMRYALLVDLLCRITGTPPEEPIPLPVPLQPARPLPPAMRNSLRR